MKVTALTGVKSSSGHLLTLRKERERIEDCIMQSEIFQVVVWRCINRSVTAVAFCAILRT